MRTNANNNNYGAKMEKNKCLKNFSAVIWSGLCLRFVCVCVFLLRTVAVHAELV